jgi:hypothetical protein
MATYAAEATGILLAKTLDSTGTEWNFVQMNMDAPHTFAPDMDFKHGDNSHVEGPVAGWVLASDLKQ